MPFRPSMLSFHFLARDTIGMAASSSLVSGLMALVFGKLYVVQLILVTQTSRLLQHRHLTTNAPRNLRSTQ